MYHQPMYPIKMEELISGRHNFGVEWDSVSHRRACKEWTGAVLSSTNVCSRSCWILKVRGQSTISCSGSRLRIGVDQTKIPLRLYLTDHLCLSFLGSCINKKTRLFWLGNIHQILFLPSEEFLEGKHLLIPARLHLVYYLWVDGQHLLFHTPL